MKIEIFIEEGTLGNKAGNSTSYYDTIREATVILIDPTRFPASPAGADAVRQVLLSAVHDAFGNNGEKLIVVPVEYEEDGETPLASWLAWAEKAPVYAATYNTEDVTGYLVPTEEEQLRINERKALSRSLARQFDDEESKSGPFAAPRSLADLKDQLDRQTDEKLRAWAVAHAKTAACSPGGTSGIVLPPSDNARSDARLFEPGWPMAHQYSDWAEVILGEVDDHEASFTWSAQGCVLSWGCREIESEAEARDHWVVASATDGKVRSRASGEERPNAIALIDWCVQLCKLNNWKW